MPMSQAEKASSDSPSARILAIDDDRDLLDTYAALVEAMGMRLTTAESLQEGLRLAATRPFDVCLLDRSVGHGLGTELLPELKAQAPRIATPTPRWKPCGWVSTITW
jgi:two-component system, NtrC family, response regulator AlgB